MKLAFTEFDLANGLHVIVHEDHSAAVVVVDVRYHAGSKDETPGKTGFAHLFEHLMFDGSKNVGRGMFDRYLTNIGAQNNAYTTPDETNYHETVPSNQVELALWLESDRMLQFAIHPVSLTTQKDVVKEEKRQSEDNRPYGDLDERMRALAYKTSNYRWTVLGSMRDIDAATLDDVREFYETYYVPNNATLCLAGDITAALARQLAEKYFGDIPRGARRIIRSAALEPPQAGERRIVLANDVPAPAHFCAFHAPGENHPDIPALDLLCAILGAGESSRLHRALVYDRQIASEAASYLDTAESASLIYIYAVAAQPERDVNEIEHELCGALEIAARDGVTERELQKAKNQKESSFVFGCATALGAADALTHAYTIAGDTNSVNREIEKYNGVTREDIQRMAREYFAPERRNIVCYAPERRRAA